MDNSSRFSRRDFIKLGAAGLVVTLAPRLAGGDGGDELPCAGQAKGPIWAMVIDQARCTGCGDCTLACRAHNDVPPDITWNRLLSTDGADGGSTFLPVPCQHCAHAPCVKVCPVRATYKRDDGIIMMDYERCIGCRYCEIACPYGVRSFNWEAFTGDNPAVPAYGQPEVPRRPRGVVEKCSFCYQRIDRGLANGLTPGVDRAATPACVNACPVGARLFGDLTDPDSPVSRALAERNCYRLREDLGTEPRVYYLPPAGAAPDLKEDEVCLCS